MGKLTFEGNDKVLQQISRANRMRVKRHDLKQTLELSEKSEDYQHAKTNYLEVVELVEAVGNIEDLKPFEADERKTVIAAVESKKAELTA